MMNAQEQAERSFSKARPQFGIKAGVNVASLTYSGNKGNTDDSKSVVGFVLGGTLDYPLAPNLSNVIDIHLHTGLEVTMKGFDQKLDNGRTLESTAVFMQVPAEVGFKFNIGKGWGLDPRAGLYFAYGVGGKSEISGYSKKYNTFSDEVLKKFDFGLSFGFHFTKNQFVFGIQGERGLVEANADNFTISGAKAYNLNIGFTAAYLF